MKRPRKQPVSKWRVIDGCPCPADIAPYIYIVLRDARQTASSIYRGGDPAAEAILNRNGKHTTRQLYFANAAQRHAWGVEGTPNPPGYSTHELHNDGVAWPHLPRGAPLHTWQQGVDSGADSREAQMAINNAAARNGWETFHPYPTSPIEGHHWGFRRPPQARGVKQRARIIYWRARLPRR